jgi:prepilin-type processing-associated H-X9-DG protein
LAELLPHVEQTAVYQRLQREQAWDAARNGPAVNVAIPVFLCPAHAEFTERPTNHTHYVGLSGLGIDAAELDIENPRAGAFGYNRRVRFQDITVATSNVAVVMETTADNGPWAAGGFSTVRGLDTEVTSYIGTGLPFGTKHKADTFFRSNPELANTCFADGSVRSLQPTNRPEVLRALVTISARATVSFDFE